MLLFDGIIEAASEGRYATYKPRPANLQRRALYDFQCINSSCNTFSASSRGDVSVLIAGDAAIDEGLQLRSQQTSELRQLLHRHLQDLMAGPQLRVQGTLQLSETAQQCRYHRRIISATLIQVRP